jgi:hypothetical protein
MKVIKLKIKLSKNKFLMLINQNYPKKKLQNHQRKKIKIIKIYIKINKSMIEI